MITEYKFQLATKADLVVTITNIGICLWASSNCQKPMLFNNQVMTQNMMTHKNRLIIHPIMTPLKKNIESS